MGIRSIEFRGKRVDNGEWIYGVPCYFDDSRHIVKYLYNAEGGYVVGAESEEVIPDTIGQYTGLKDKNGTKIFEGDILKIVDDEGNTDFSDGGVGNVEFAYGLWYVSGKPQNGLWDLLQAYYCEVIGNIYDNPNLLKGVRE